jgi:hypothetical protein
MQGVGVGLGLRCESKVVATLALVLVTALCGDVEVFEVDGSVLTLLPPPPQATRLAANTATASRRTRIKGPNFL